MGGGHGRNVTRPRAPAISPEEAKRQAESEGLLLIAASNSTGYRGVHAKLDRMARCSHPYDVCVHQDGKQVCLGSFACKEQAALCLASLAADCAEHASLIVSEGGVPPLVGLLLHGSGGQREQAALALGAVAASSTTNAAEIGGAIPELRATLQLHGISV